MPDIKIEKMKYTLFLKSVQQFIENLNNDLLSQDQQYNKNYISEYINKEQDIMMLMERRKLYYSFYIKNKNKDMKTSNEMYRKYIEIKAEIDKLKEDEL